MRYVWIGALALVLAGCESKPDYSAMRKCQDMGHEAGSEGYDRCVREEKAIKMLEQQRRDYDRMKQQERDQKMYQY